MQMSTFQVLALEPIHTRAERLHGSSVAILEWRIVDALVCFLCPALCNIVFFLPAFLLRVFDASLNFLLVLMGTFWQRYWTFSRQKNTLLQKLL